MFSLIYVWINGWVNNHEAGDLRRSQAHYDVIVMKLVSFNNSFIEVWALGYNWSDIIICLDTCEKPLPEPTQFKDAYMRR